MKPEIRNQNAQLSQKSEIRIGSFWFWSFIGHSGFVILVLGLAVPAYAHERYEADVVSATPIGSAADQKEVSSTFFLPPGRGMIVELALRNVGWGTWSRNVSILAADEGTTKARHRSWRGQTVARLRERVVPEGSLGHFRVAVVMPATSTHSVHFRLTAGRIAFARGEITFTLRDPNFVSEPLVQPPVPATGIPNIRIGITKVTDPITIVGPDVNGISTAQGYDAHPTWNQNLNDNRFRGKLEIVTAANGEQWLVNELPLEQYVAGIAEEAEGMPLEHLKAMATAARTYAYYHLQRGGKHKEFGFHLLATPADQVYKGVGFEERAPSWVRATQETAGLIIAYQDQPILAAYSSGTCGRTKSFTEVWGGEPNKYAYLVSVPDLDGVILNCVTLPGNHQVGLSAAGSRSSARAGRTFEDILKYYYTGVALKKIY